MLATQLQLSIRTIDASRRNSEPRLKQTYPKLFGKEAGFNPFASSAAPSGSAGDEKCHIRPKFCSQYLQLLRPKSGVMKFIQQSQGRGGVRAAPTKPSADRNLLFQTNGVRHIDRGGPIKEVGSAADQVRRILVELRNVRLERRQSRRFDFDRVIQ